MRTTPTRRAYDRDAHADGRRGGAAARRRGGARGGGGAADEGRDRRRHRQLRPRARRAAGGTRTRRRDRLSRRGPRRRARRPSTASRATRTARPFATSTSSCSRRSRPPRSTPRASSPTRSGARRSSASPATCASRRAACCPGGSSTSLAEEVAEILEAPVAAGLQTLAAVHLTHRDAPDQDALICGDDLGAKSISLELADRLVARARDRRRPAGNARALEGLTAVMVNVNKRYRTHAGIRVTGLEE